MSESRYEAAHDKKVKSWLKKLAAEEKAHRDFRKEAEKAQAIYEREDYERKKTVFPMYTANCNILHAALFSDLPDPDVRRPYIDRGDNDLAQAVERAIDHLRDTETYSHSAHRAVSEWLSGGLGVLWLNYQPEIIEVPVMGPVVDELGQVVGEEPLRDEDGKLVTEPSIESQTITLEYHPWNRFHWEPAVVWEDVDWISFAFVKTAAQIKKDYGKDLNNLDKRKRDEKSTSANAKDHVVHHIWCKKSNKIYVVSEAHRSCLAEWDDPLGLEGFWPCPRPLMMNVKSGEITPRPDYVYIETQHDNIQVLTDRINTLTKGVKDIGFYEAAVFDELAGIEHAEDGRYLPVPNMLERLNGRDSSNVIVSVDMTNKVNTLDRLRQQREDEKSIIYELQGIADIVRGASVASETATAQAIKDKHFQVRLSEKINELRRYWRDLYRIIAEIIGEHFTAESFFMMSGVELDQQQLSALMNEFGRTYMIDVETEDTTFEDDEKQRQQGIDLIRVMNEVLTQHFPAVQSGAMPADFLTQMLTFGSNLFKDGRVLEDGLAALPDTATQFAQMQQTMQEMQGQIEQMGAENQQLQQALQQAQQQASQVEIAEKSADIQGKGAKAAKDAADARKTQVETAQMVAGQGYII